MKEFYNAVINQMKDTQYPVNSRELYRLLKVGSSYRAWINNKKKRLNFDCEINDNINYITLEAMVNIIKSTKTTAEKIKLESLFKNIFDEIQNREEIFIPDPVTTEEENISLDKILPFKNKDFGEIRMTVVDNKVYAYAVDIANALDYKNPHKALKDHCRSIKKCIIPNKNIKGSKTINIIDQSDIIRLILSSKQPKAVKFETWIIDEVIPSVLNNGLYMTTNKIDEFLNNPDYAIKILEKYKEEREQKEQLLKEKEANMYKIVGYDKFISGEGCYSIGTVAKMLKIKVTPYSKIVVGKNTLLSMLRRDNILISNGKERNVPYQRYINNGWFKLIAKDGEIVTNKSKLDVYVTPSGMTGLYKKYNCTGEDEQEQEQLMLC